MLDIARFPGIIEAVVRQTGRNRGAVDKSTPGEPGRGEESGEKGKPPKRGVMAQGPRWAGKEYFSDCHGKAMERYSVFSL